MVINTFIVAYNELKKFMASKLFKLKEEMISCDHTFKLASHVGFYHSGRWVPQYDSLFIIQNEHGVVLFWQLTKGTAYSSVCDGIEELKNRCQIKMAIIGNCCMWKNAFSDTLGESVKVKLDLFHAVKRISSAISKKLVELLSTLFVHFVIKA